MAFNAQKLAEYILTGSEFEVCDPSPCPYNNHIGALFTDIILQAGVNYGTVVHPQCNLCFGELFHRRILYLVSM